MDRLSVRCGKFERPVTLEQNKKLHRSLLVLLATTTVAIDLWQTVFSREIGRCRERRIHAGHRLATVGCREAAAVAATRRAAAALTRAGGLPHGVSGAAGFAARSHTPCRRECMNKKQIAAFVQSLVERIQNQANADAPEGEPALTEAEARTLLGVHLRQNAPQIVGAVVEATS
jgi:hypothetical protein